MLLLSFYSLIMPIIDFPLVFARNSGVIRSLFFILLLVLEICILTIHFDTQEFKKIDLPLLNLLGFSGEFLRFAIATMGALVIFLSTRLKIISPFFNQNSVNLNWKLWLSVHFFLILGLYGLSDLIFKGIPENVINNTTIINIVIVSWLLVGVFSLLFWLLAITSYSCWIRFISQERRILYLSIVTGFLVWGISQLSQMAWRSLADLTFWFANYILQIAYSDVVFDLSRMMLGTSNFKVIISSQCSGYEGISLVTVFLCVYLWVDKDRLRFPHAFFLFPIGVTAIFLLNSLRIAILIAIGSSWSPEIAVGGFHSNAGWIAFVFISVGLVLICQHLAFFKKEFTDNIKPTLVNNTGATFLLLPFIVLLAFLLFSSLFIIKFDWLYPLRIIGTAGVLWYFRNYYKKYVKNISSNSVIIGILVFVIWIILVPSSSFANQEFANELFSVYPVLTYSWLFFRIAGASIIIPVTEELVFRGYLIAKLIDNRFETVKAGQFTWLSFLGSSVLFGLMHGEWLAGIIAGMCFAFAFYKRGELYDAIIAHITANILLSAYVVGTQNWSLW